jgi:hypothetical protein
VSALHFTKRTDKTADSWLGSELASLSEKGWDRLLALAKTPGINAEQAAVAIELVVRARILRQVHGGPHGRKIYPSDIVEAGLLWKTEDFREEEAEAGAGESGSASSSTEDGLGTQPPPPTPAPRSRGHSSVLPPEGFKCEHEGCKAPPLQMQYRLKHVILLILHFESDN